jgi:hypothetical protein
VQCQILTVMIIPSCVPFDSCKSLLLIVGLLVQTTVRMTVQVTVLLLNLYSAVCMLYHWITTSISVL